MSQQSDEAWVRFDALVAGAGRSSPWVGGSLGERRYAPDFELLESLLAVPIDLECSTQSGIPAKAVDVWVAHELRRARFDEDEVWPRATAPRVLPIEVAELLRRLPTELATAVRARIDSGKVGGLVASMDAHVLGKAYEKQVDCVIARWSRGVELMVSTKRMDSSFSNNALNRIEESYGDAKNLRARHPLAAIGFLFVIRSTALTTARSTTEKLMDLLAALSREDDAYDATGLIISDWDDKQSGPVSLSLMHDEVPTQLRIDRFLQTMIEAVLSRTPISTHTKARECWLDRQLAVSDDSD